jgi:hypothetical protein
VNSIPSEWLGLALVIVGAILMFVLDAGLALGWSRLRERIRGRKPREPRQPWSDRTGTQTVDRRASGITTSPAEEHGSDGASPLILLFDRQSRER